MLTATNKQTLIKWPELATRRGQSSLPEYKPFPAVSEKMTTKLEKTSALPEGFDSLYYHIIVRALPMVVVLDTVTRCTATFQ